MKKYLFSLFLFIGFQTFAADVDTVSIYSNAMHRAYKAVVIRPDSYKKKSLSFPTVYLMHGLTGDFSNWIMKVPQLKKYVDDYQLIVVCPDGAYNSWYWDSPVDSTKRFETYVSKEIPAYIEANYRTVQDRRARAITGLSMGGHGGLFLGFRHADYFGACGSMSGALAIELITDKNYGTTKLLGDTTNKQRYRDYSIFGEMEHRPKDTLAIIMDCGTEDFIVEMSRLAHKRMLELKIPHDYTERPGKHDWNYWGTAVQYQLLYFRNYFNKQAAQLQSNTSK
ncbi:MAG: XynC protein [Flaviaesturariibacter sp.]|nr:XynC protein [Flaviaesturariibacter sp.]